MRLTFAKGWISNSVVTPAAFAPLAVNFSTPGDSDSTSSVMLSPRKSVAGGMSGIVPFGLSCRNFAAYSMKTEFAVG